MDIWNNEKLIRILRENKRSTIVLVLFLIAFSYALFFTQCVPFFFDDHDIHSSYVQLGFKSKFLQLFNPNYSATFSGPRPIYSLFFITLFPFFGLDYCSYRIAKAIIFGLLILAIYFLSDLLFKRQIPAITAAVLIMIAFPSFIQTFGYNGSHIFAELFKVLTIIYFLKEIQEDKQSTFRQCLIFLFALFAIRSYDPSYSIAAILPLFTLLYRPEKFLKYTPLFLLIIFIQFPLGIFFETTDHLSGSVYTPKLINIQHVFTDAIIEHIRSPIPHYSNLYYKPAIAILTFFGFWLIILALAGITIQKLHLQTFTKYFIENEQKNEASFNKRMIIFLTSVWMLSELPTYIFLPEHAIRYLFTFLVPFTILAVYLILSFANIFALNYKKYVIFIISVFVMGIILTNISYTYAFRAGWGSSFLVFEEAMDFMAEEKSKTEQNFGVLYNAGSAADEYFYVNKSSTDYSFGKGITYIKTANLNDFSEESLQNKSETYDQFYVLKRTTSVSGTGYPPLSFDNYSSLEEIGVLYGYSEDILFDRVNEYVMPVLGVSYQPNKVLVYKYIDTKEAPQ